MSVKLYDEALLKKLQYWTGDTHTTIVGADESSRLFATIADISNDKKLNLPLISLSRPGGFVINDKYKQPKSYNGMSLAHNNTISAKLNAINIAIPYQLNIYTRYQEEADEYVRNIVFNIINYPKLTIELPYHQLDVKHDSSIRLTSDVEDNSNIPERLISGQFTRYTLEIVVDDAYLFDINVKDNIIFKSVQLEVSDSLEDTSFSKIEK